MSNDNKDLIEKIHKDVDAISDKLFITQERLHKAINENSDNRHFLEQLSKSVGSLHEAQQQKLEDMWGLIRKK